MCVICGNRIPTKLVGLSIRLSVTAGEKPNVRMNIFTYVDGSDRWAGVFELHSRIYGGDYSKISSL
jgi:hypothetical protein